jgi:Replication protein
MNLLSEQQRSQTQIEQARLCETVVSVLTGSEPSGSGPFLFPNDPAVGSSFPPEASATASVADFDSLPGIEVESDDLAEGCPEFIEACAVQLETRGTSSHALQGSLWRTGEVFAASIAAKLREAGRYDLCEPLEHCHSESIHLRCTGCKRTNTVWNRCDLFYCARCQPRLARERSESVEWWTHQIAQPKHIVLTLQNTIGFTTDHVRHIIKSFSRLRRMKIWRNVTGGFYRVEVTNEGKGWHLHLHVLCDVRFIDSGLLAQAWDKANRQTGYIVKVKDCRDRDYIREVTKYAVKGSELARWPGCEIATFIDALTGIRTFGVFGVLYGKRTEWREWLETIAVKRGTCVCGCSDFKVCSDKELEWLELQVGCPPSSKPAVAPQLQQIELGEIVRTAFNLYS